MDFIELNLFYFLFLIVYYWNINHVFDHLTQKYGNKDFVVNIFWKKIYLVNTSDTLRVILSSKTNELTYIQKNLNRYLGHQYTINCMDSSTATWKTIHGILKETLNNSKVRISIECNKYILFDEHDSLNTAVE